MNISQASKHINGNSISFSEVGGDIPVTSLLPGKSHICVKF